MQYSVVLPQRALSLGAPATRGAPVTRQLTRTNAATPADDEQAFAAMQATVPDDFRLENRFDFMKDDIFNGYNWVRELMDGWMDGSSSQPFDNLSTPICARAV